MDIDKIKELAKTVAESLNLKDHTGDIVGVKVVEYEFGNIEDGGIGVQIINGSKEKPMTVTDKEIKAALEELLRAKDKDGKLVFRNKKQWWAVFKVLSTFCNYPQKMTVFKTKIDDMKLDYGGNDTNKITYESLSAAPGDVPQMAGCSPTTWSTLKELSENYRQMEAAADFLMIKLGIKS